MSEISPNLVIRLNFIGKFTHMAKIQLKYGKITAFGGLFPIMDEFNRVLSGFVDSTLGFRCKLFGYQYSEIIRSIMCVYFCDAKTTYKQSRVCLALYCVERKVA